MSSMTKVIARLLKQLSGYTLVASLCCMLSAMDAYGQHDVHASLVSRVARRPAPAFHLVAADGRQTSASSYQGSVLLLNFWATKCGGCVLEIPSFVELEQAYGTRGFTAIGISADIPYEGLKNADEAWGFVRPFMVSHKINYPILMGDPAVVDAYGFQAYPATFLIDKSGKIAAAYVGVVNKADVEKKIKTLLAER